MKVVYIASPYRSDSENGVFENIIRAREVAVKLWERGYAVICPHTNSFFMGSRLGDSHFLEGDLEIVKRCDIVLRLQGESVGADNEVALAKALGIAVYYNFDDIP